MSLRIPDQYYRSRSKSRERSRSRHGRDDDDPAHSHGRSRSRGHSRARSPPQEKEKKSKKYYDYDSFEDEAPRRASSRQTSQYREVSPSDDEMPLASRNSRDPVMVSDDRYYHSDQHEPDYRYTHKSKTSAKSKRSSHHYDSHSDVERAPAPQPSATAYHSSRPSQHLEPEYWSASGDDDLAYGDPYDYPLASNHHLRSQERSRQDASADSRRTYESDARHEYPTKDHQRYPYSQTKESSERRNLFEEQDAPASYPRDGQPASTQKSTLSNAFEHLKSQFYPSSFADPRPSQQKAPKIDLDAWAEIPECEREGYVPPVEQNIAAGPMGSPTSAASDVPNIYAVPTQYYQHQPVAPPSALATPELPPRPQNSATYTRPIPGMTPGRPASNNPYPGVPVSRYVPQQYTQTPSAPQTLAAKTEAQGHKRAVSTGNLPTQQTYNQQDIYQYAVPDSQVRYSSKTQAPTATTGHDKIQTSAKASGQPKQASYMEIKPRHQSASNRPNSLLLAADDQMKIPGGFPDGNNRPASPLLEPYRGTYQSISPIQWPTPLGDDGLSDIEPLNGRSNASRGRKKNKRDSEITERLSKDQDERIRRLSTNMGAGAIKVIEPKEPTYSYDPKEDAKLIHAALSHSKVNPKPLIQILPYLTSDEILDLRSEYKSLRVMTRKGVNIAKHIKMMVPGNFGKVCYATALGQWESEALWANFWYQSSRTRHELLIESLIGRPNVEIQEIKACFRDKRYQDNLELCMETELRADKFRTAILLALQEKRQSDHAPLNIDLVRKDVHSLHHAVTSRDGGETAMIQIIIVRGNAHLREVLQAYEDKYHENFVRALLSKSRNLVGETLVHVLNGIRNRPMRDALLVHQAITESGTGKDRAELLISRLVRLHWEPRHLERVKSEYRRKYGRYIEDQIEEEIIEAGGAGAHEKKTEWAEFCVELVKSSGYHLDGEDP